MEVYINPESNSIPQEPQELAANKLPSVSKNIDKKYVVFGLGIGFTVVLGAFLLLFFTNGSEGINQFKKSVFNPLLKDVDKQIGEDKYKVQSTLNGLRYTEEESASWINKRPLGVMINNHVDARPQAGLINADIVYEIVAEGGITRFLAFYQSDIPEKLGPIRSTREYYLVLTKEVGDAMLMHHGFSPQALVAIESWPVRSLQRGDAPYWRENPRNVAIEHTLYANGKELMKKGVELGWDGVNVDFRPWLFSDSSELYNTKAPADKISYDFWYAGDFSVAWEYNAQTASYKRFMGLDAQQNPISHVDDVTKAQLEVKNIIVQFALEEKVPGDDKNRLDYQLVGSGKALVFVRGKVLEATWSKSDRDAHTLFYDTEGKEIEFNPGKIWVSILPDRNSDLVNYSSAQPPAPSN